MFICITGKPGSGKTATIEILKKANEQTFIVDEYVHAIYKKDEIGYKLIKQNFGSDYVNEIEVDRKKLGQLVFSDSNKLKLLNDLINPLIKEKILSFDRKNKIFIELGTYIYYHEYFSGCFDKVIYIHSENKRQKNSIKNKFLHLKKFPTIFVGKLTKSEKSTKNNVFKYNNLQFLVDYVVDNSKNKINLKKNILKINSII